MSHIQDAITAIDAEIAELHKVRAALAELLPVSTRKAGRVKTAGRPAVKRKRKPMSAASRRAISRSTKKRWAEFHRLKAEAASKKR
jgi:hypothetical protein